MLARTSLAFVQRLVILAAIVISLILIACQSKEQTPSQAQLDQVRDSIRVFAASVAHDVTREGSKAWLRFFSHSPQFFMASEGKLVFPTIDSATVFVDSLAVWIRNIQLNWSDVSVDPLTTQLAVFRASFHEVVMERSGHEMKQDGFCTATVERNALGWQFRNLHWSTGGNQPR
jgi:hypothetical protein